MKPIGRPTVYKPEYCEQVVEMGKAGKSIVQMAAAFDVSRECIYEWTRVHPQFSDAIARAKVHAQDWWENAGQQGMVTSGFNAGVWSKMMSARFREDYCEPKNVVLSGDAANPVQTVTRVEIVAVEAKAAE